MTRYSIYTLLCTALLIGAAGCGVPPPRQVTHACLEKIASKKYDKALSYCGPKLHRLSETHDWLIPTHRRLTRSTTYTIHSIDRVSPTQAQVNVSVRFDLRDRRTYKDTYLFDLTRRDKWYIDDVSYTSSAGEQPRSILDTLPRSFY